MAGKKGLKNGVGGATLRVVLHLAVLLEDDLFLLVDLVLAKFEAEEDVFLIAKGEVGLGGRERDLERGQVLAGVAVEIGAVTPDVPPHLGARTRRCPPEKEAVLEKVDEAARLLRFILGPDIEAGDDMDEGNVALLEEENPETVVEDEVTARFGGREGPGGKPETGGQNGPRNRRFQARSDHDLNQRQFTTEPAAPLKGPVPRIPCGAVPSGRLRSLPLTGRVC